MKYLLYSSQFYIWKNNQMYTLIDTVIYLIKKQISKRQEYNPTINVQYLHWLHTNTYFGYTYHEGEMDAAIRDD